MEMKARLANYFKAGYPAIAIQTTEEARAMGDIIEAAKTAGNKEAFLAWSAVEGTVQTSPRPGKIGDTEDLLAACNKVRVPNAVYVMRDVSGWPFDRDPVIARAFRDLVAWGPENGSCVVVVEPSFKPHPTVEKMFVLLDYPLPDADTFRQMWENIGKLSGVKMNGDGEAVVRALGGLSTTEAENALSLSIVETGKFDADVIYREKVAGVKRSGLLEIVDPDPRGIDAIGGLDLLKAWMRERAEMFNRWKDAEQEGLPSMKGVLLVGPPGTGKSLTAKCCGTILRVPMLRWDVASTFASLVGETERRTRETLMLADAMAPCGLWLDEVDKAFAGTSSGGANDSGVGMRMFGQVITWMQERKRPVFLFATANDVTNLPSAFYRKGRFDEIFSLDLPTAEERVSIFKVHFNKGKRPVGIGANMYRLALATENFVGAEIEAVVDGARIRAFAQKRNVTEDDFIEIARRTVPVATTAPEEIAKMRKWSSTRATPASSPEATKAAPAVGGRKVSAAK